MGDELLIKNDILKILENDPSPISKNKLKNEPRS